MNEKNATQYWERETGNKSQGPLGNCEKQFPCRQVDTGLLNNKCVIIDDILLSKN
jgi:hypothetical protein